MSKSGSKMDENSSTSAGRLKEEKMVGGVEVEEGEGRDCGIESVWKQPYKGKEREESAADTVQTADKGRWDERKRKEGERERKKRRAHTRESEMIWDGETKGKVAFGEEKLSGRRENNVMVKVETEREEETLS